MVYSKNMALPDKILNSFRAVTYNFLAHENYFVGYDILLEPNTIVIFLII